jgi:hypothetical protein
VSVPASVPPPGVSGSTGVADPPPVRYAKTDIAALVAGGLKEEQPTILERTDGACLFYAGTVNSIIGESESGKTWMALLAVKQELGKGHNVMFLDYEDTAVHVVKRLMDMEVPTDLIVKHFTYIQPEGMFGEPDEEALLSYGLGDCTLVVLDGVTEALAIHNFNGREEGDVALFYELLPKWLAKQGPAVVLIDHVAKSKESRGNTAIGSQHKRAAITGASYAVENKKPISKGAQGESFVTLAKDKLGGIDYSSATSTRFVGMLHVDSDPAIFVVEAYIKPGSIGPKVAPADAKTLAIRKAILKLTKDKAKPMLKTHIRDGLPVGTPGNATDKAAQVEYLAVHGYLMRTGKEFFYVKDYDASEVADD